MLRLSKRRTLKLGSERGKSVLTSLRGHGDTNCLSIKESLSITVADRYLCVLHFLFDSDNNNSSSWPPLRQIKTRNLKLLTSSLHFRIMKLTVEDMHLSISGKLALPPNIGRTSVSSDSLFLLFESTPSKSLLSDRRLILAP